jgi:competence protein ComEC
MNETKVTFWDVQHGNAVYINTPNNRHIVIDLGIGSYGNRKEFSPLRYLKSNITDQLDYVIITHPHLDHIDDILNFDLLSPKVLHRPRHLSKENILQSIRDSDREKFNKYFEINDRYDGAISNTLNDPSISANWGGLSILTFSPKNCSQSNINNHSIITVIEYENVKVVFVGDNESCSYKELLETEPFRLAVKDADVLLASHHGRESGYHNDFVSLVNPRITIVSDGRFGDSSATTRYSNKSRGWTIYKSDGSSSKRYCLTTRQDGTIVATFGSNSGKPFLNIKID